MSRARSAITGSTDGRGGAPGEPAIAYLVLAHTAPTQLARLCRALDDGSADVFVHLDAKQDLAPFAAQPLPAGVRFLEDRVRVSWAAWSQVEATLRLIRAALGSGRRYSHLVMLSGLDYPIKPVAALRELFRRHPRRQFIRFIDASGPAHFRIFHEHYWFMEELRWLPSGWLQTKLRRGFGRALRQVLRKPRPAGLVPCWGSAYWALTPACCAHLLQTLEDRPDILAWLRSSFAPDEQCFHTLVANSPFLADSDGFMPYPGPSVHWMANLHRIPEGLRRVHTEADFEALRGSGKYFVRKVMPGASDALLDRLDREVLGLPFADPPAAAARAGAAVASSSSLPNRVSRDASVPIPAGRAGGPVRGSPP